MEKKLAGAVENVEALKDEPKTSILRAETSDFKKENIKKEPAFPRGNYDALRSELKCSILQQETADLENEEGKKKLARAVEIVEALKTEIKLLFYKKEGVIWRKSRWPKTDF
jgi:hypothetical protein